MADAPGLRAKRDVLMEVVRRTAGKYPFLAALAVFLGCVVDAVVLFHG